MNPAMNDLVLHLSAGATTALISAIWQGALLAALVGLALRLFPALSAGARSAIWLNVFILLALLHIVPFFAAASAQAGPIAAHPLHFDPRWSLALAALWLALSLFRAAQLVQGAIHLRRLAHRATSVAPSHQIQPHLQHGRRIIQLATSPEVARPSVLGFFRPRILLPPELLQNLSPAELQQVVIHEMQHLRRADDWTNLLQKLTLVLFPLNPALAWVERRLCAERELACDDRVLSSGAGRKAYALCLAHLAEFGLLRRGFSLVLGAWERRPELARRVHRILSQPARSMGRRPAFAASASLIAVALGCTLVLARAPQLVSFAPPLSIAQAAPGVLDRAAVARSLGGTPQLIRATMPNPSSARPSPQPVRAVAHRAARKPAPPSRLADLRLPPPPPSATMLVFTAWSQDDRQAQTQMLIAITDPAPPDSQSQQAQPHPQPQQNHQPRPSVVTARYAVVATPAGWFIVQI